MSARIQTRRQSGRSGDVELPGTVAHDCDARPDQLEHQRCARDPGAHERGHHGEGLHPGHRGECARDAEGDLCRAEGARKTGCSIVKGKNLVRFGTVGVCGGRQVIDLKGLGA